MFFKTRELFCQNDTGVQIMEIPEIPNLQKRIKKGLVPCTKECTLHWQLVACVMTALIYIAVTRSSMVLKKEVWESISF